MLPTYHLKSVAAVRQDKPLLTLLHPVTLGGNLENVWKNTELCPWNVETADTGNNEHNEQGHQ